MNTDKYGLYKVALKVAQTLQKHGFDAYFAGGCVRDRLMHRPPKDYDVATNARPNQVIKLFKKTIAVGKAFGVVVVVFDNQQIEVTTFRTEGPYTDGRHPDSVKYTSAQEDVSRRDFTINGLLYDPVKNKLLDLVDGKADIKRKLIRTIGDPLARFKEDKLRMLRAIRFACELGLVPRARSEGFKIDTKTLKAIKQLAPRIKQISAERIRDELKRILISPLRDRGVELLDKTGLLKHILSEVVKLKGVKQPPQFHPEGDVYTHTLLCLKSLRKPSWELALATLLHDIGKPKTFMITDRIRFHEHERVGSKMAERICQRLKLSNAEIEKVVWLVDRHMVFKDAEKMRLSTLKKLFRHPAYPELAELHRVDRVASDLDLKPYYFCARMYKKLTAEDLKPKPLINGHDLIKMGLKPGPIFSVILKKVEEAQLDNKVSTKPEALNLARKMADVKVRGV